MHLLSQRPPFIDIAFLVQITKQRTVSVRKNTLKTLPLHLTITGELRFVHENSLFLQVSLLPLSSNPLLGSICMQKERKNHLVRKESRYLEREWCQVNLFYTQPLKFCPIHVSKSTYIQSMPQRNWCTSVKSHMQPHLHEWLLLLIWICMCNPRFVHLQNSFLLLKHVKYLI